MKVVLFVSLLLLAAATLAQTGRAPTPDPFTAFKGVPVQTERLAGRPLARVSDGDFVHPALSPDGTALAYSKVLVRDKSESTEVLLLELHRRRTSILLHAK